MYKQQAGLSNSIKCLASAIVLAVSLLSHSVLAATEVVDVRLSSTGEQSTRLVLDLSSPVEHSLFTLRSPERVVIDLKNTALATNFPKQAREYGLLRGIRSAPRNGGDLRVVLDLQGGAQPKSFLLKPSGQAGHRLVIDLHKKSNGDAARVAKTLPKPKKLRDVVVAVDAGHGGKDPGAIGRSGTYEKHVVLAIAQELANQINKTRGMKAVLIRTGDYYIGLRDRMKKAREHKADLFISLHADAFKNRQAHGSSVYALSLRGASSEAAQWLANRENSSELVGGVSLDDKDDLVASVLLDLSQTATIQSSLEVADEILTELGQQTKLHKRSVQQAGFIVLKSPDIPSVLIETAFISNPTEERKLKDKKHQRKTSAAILRGIKRYFQRKAPPGTLLAHERPKSVVGDKFSANF